MFANAAGQERTIVADFNGTTVSGGPGGIGIVGLDDGTTNNRVLMRAILTDGAAQSTVATGGGIQANTTAAARPINGNARQALRLTADGRITTATGGAIVIAQGSPLSIPTTDRVSLGVIPGSVFLNGYIRRARVLPYAASDAELQALTT